jgi:hypothetical protein
MVLLTATPRILSALASLPPTSLSALPLTIPKDASDPIEHTTLIRLAQLSQTSLNALLRGTKPYTPPPVQKPPPSAEYLALKARLLAQQEQREYAAMVNKAQGFEQDVEQTDEDNIPVSLPFNILVSVLCCGGAVFYMTRYWNNAGLRVLLSLGVAVLVGVAEVVVYSGYLRKVKEARRKERAKLERKEVMLVSGEDEKAMLDVRRSGTEEKEQIWGRGINGGMRRRVREKWEKEQENTNAVEDEKSK